MARVLERLRWPQNRLLVRHSSSAPRVDLRILELQAAKEILAEIFGVRISDVAEMIQNRYENACCCENLCEQEEMWPREFLLVE